MGFFLLMFGGGFNDSLKEKLTKIIQSFGSNYFEFPTDPEVFSEKLDNMKKKILELTDTLKLTESHINSLLNYLESPQISCSLIEEYRFFLTKEKYIYTIMNYFKQHDGDVIKVRCWCSLLDEPIVKLTLKTVAKAESHQTAGEFIEIPEKSNEIPPTFFKTNDFLAPFQEIVNTYGIPRYQEINPGLFTIISFPFLFGVMFGDIGHGLLLLSFGIFLCCFQEKMKDLIKIRYLLVLMGFFSVFCGFIYNEIFSLPLNLFGSCYQKTDKIVSRAEDCVYPFGMDPIWAVSTNELAFFNSFKMKLAVILGVSQMILGILIKGANTIRTNNFLDFFFEFLPQIFFMASTFVYLDIMIIIKWCIYWDNAGATSPGLIQQFLNLGLKMGAVDENPLYGTSKEQEFYQTILFFIAMITVPMMLITKPVMIYNSRKKEKETKQKMKKEHQIINRSSGLDLYGDIKEEAKDEDEDEDTEGKAFIERGTEKQLKEVLKSMRDFDSASESSVTKHKSDEPMSEIIVHQIIETIEFVLGSISNTASYLRLWALSLAHSQLSKVFFQKTVLGALEEKNYIGILVGVFVFLNITFAVLMCMDVMECFLHALRLHWVEFQNKFFKADGYKFHPFSYLELYRNELA